MQTEILVKYALVVAVLLAISILRGRRHRSERHSIAQRRGFEVVGTNKRDE